LGAAEDDGEAEASGGEEGFHDRNVTATEHD
jgi:hypothetical protein